MHRKQYTPINIILIFLLFVFIEKLLQINCKKGKVNKIKFLAKGRNDEKEKKNSIRKNILKTNIIFFFIYDPHK